MHNMVYLIGRLAHDIHGNDMTIAVQRTFKNEDGIYDTDFVKCKIFGSIAENTAEYCHKGDLVGIKGRIETKEDEMYIVIEKISFLASKRK